jgi:hypothetical protein
MGRELYQKDLDVVHGKTLKAVDKLQKNYDDFPDKGIYMLALLCTAALVSFLSGGTRKGFMEAAGFYFDLAERNKQ